MDGPSTSSDNEGSTERPSKKLRVAFSLCDAVRCMYLLSVRRDDDADDHTLMLSTLTGGHGFCMAQTAIADDPHDEWYDPSFDCNDGPVSVFFQPADDDPPEVVLSRLDGLAPSGPAPVRDMEPSNLYF